MHLLTTLLLSTTTTITTLLATAYSIPPNLSALYNKHKVCPNSPPPLLPPPTHPLSRINKTVQTLPPPPRHRLPRRPKPHRQHIHLLQRPKQQIHLPAQPHARRPLRQHGHRLRRGELSRRELRLRRVHPRPNELQRSCCISVRDSRSGRQYTSVCGLREYGL